MKRNLKPKTITVSFKKGIRPDGEIVSVRISDGESELGLTSKQALQLSAQISGKIRSETP